MKVDELAAVWPEDYPRPADSTNENHAYMVRAFAEDFRGREVRSISRDEARHWALANLGAARYVRAMFNDAAADALISDNPFAGLALPPPGESVVDYPSKVELATLVSVAREEGHYWLADAIEFAAGTGLRVGEQSAILVPGDGGMGNFLMLRADHDTGLMERGEVRWQRAKDGTLRRPKTKASLREFVVFGEARPAVEDAIERRKKGSAFLFPSRHALEHEWRWLRRETGLHFRWHAFRHYHATWLLDQGAKVDDVAVQLGCSVKTVEDHYGHPDAGLALGRLEAMTAGPGSR